MDREILLRRAALKCVDFSRQITYHREMTPYISSLKSNYWIYTFNNFIDMAVLDWCHLFGSHSDDLHFRNIITNPDEFKNELLAFIGLDEDGWIEYRDSVKNYRDKDVAHLEIRPTTIVPDLDTGIKTVGFYYNSIIEELKGFGKYDIFLDNLFKYFERIHENTEELVREHLHNLFALQVQAK